MPETPEGIRILGINQEYFQLNLLSTSPINLVIPILARTNCPSVARIIAKSEIQHSPYLGFTVITHFACILIHEEVLFFGLE
jgi:hypothetical protein